MFAKKNILLAHQFHHLNKNSVLFIDLFKNLSVKITTMNEEKVNIRIYKNTIFNTKDVVEVSIKQKKLYFEKCSFNDISYKINEKQRIIVNGIKQDGESISNGLNLIPNNIINEKKEENHETVMNIPKETLYYDIHELKSLYFFFLINMLRFKKNIHLELVKTICDSINNMGNSVHVGNKAVYNISSIINGNNIEKCNSNKYSTILKRFLISNLTKINVSEYNSIDFYRSIDIVIEKCSFAFLNSYKTISFCNYLTCCLCNMMELFKINCDVLFKNAFNNNINNSNIKSINLLVSRIKWMIHDSKIEKEKNISAQFSSNILLFVYVQSKLNEECDYFTNLINQNFKNTYDTVDTFTNEYTNELSCLQVFIHTFCKNVCEYLTVHINNVLDIIKKVLPYYINKMVEFIMSKEMITNEHVELKKPLDCNGFLYMLESDVELDEKKIRSIFFEQYENKYVNDVKNRLGKLSSIEGLEKYRELNNIFNKLLLILTDINIHMNIMYDIKAYNKASVHFLKSKKLTGGFHNIGLGCLEFKNFIYSVIRSCGKSYTSMDESVLMEPIEMIKDNLIKDNLIKDNLIKDNLIKENVIKNNLIICNRVYSMLNKHFDFLQYTEKICEILLPKNINFNLKVAKGAKDITGSEMQVRNLFFDFIKKKFLLHGGVEIDTPIFELKETLMDKYGEDSKLIFDLKDQGGEILSLRYDLTIPLYRFVNTHNLNSLKRFHIGKVYRRDEPSMNRGRFREFYQCDFDIVGKYDTLRTDFHILYIFWDILTSFKNVIGDFNCKINNRKILEYMLLSCNISQNKIKTVSSSIDKLDKISFDQFRNELINEKGIAIEWVNKIEYYLSKTMTLTPFEVIDFLKKDLSISVLDETYKKEIEVVINNMKEIFNLLKHFQMINKFSFDLSLARGLDYYTGIIFEFVLISENSMVGSIAAGGRYDTLIRNKRKQYIPAIGASIGIERIITIAEEMIKKKKNLLFTSKNIIVESVPNKAKEQSDNIVDKNKMKSEYNEEIKTNLKDSDVEVLICNVKKDSFKETIELCKKLWEENIPTEFSYTNDQKLQKQLVYALEKQIPLIVIIGDEIENGIIKIRELAMDKNKSVGEKQVNINDCVQEIKKYFKNKLTWRQSMVKMMFNSELEAVE
ncbi:histidine--tRNA ligase, putative [Hepatocystis sp. ex Piliocolobus tephrosceles]|nr:histidine--tRNA ligase, putative [Hepatocystis sp. ex Piliocolobus tephrosceles]